MKKYSVFIEMVTAIAAVAFLIYKLRSMLLFGETTLMHDNIYWAYPIFQFFAENIINGNFPFWDPFNFGGEPFYPLIMQVRLLEPITVLTIYLGQFITNDIIMLFNWNHFIKSLAMLFGVYMVFRPLAEHTFIRISLIPILLYSSFMLASFRQVGIIDQFLLIPFITYFLLRILYHKDYRWHNWLLFAVLIGLNWQLYTFAATWIFLLFFSFGLLFFRRDLLVELLKSRIILPKLVVTAAIIFVMAMPNIILLLEKDNYVFPTRFADPKGRDLDQLLRVDKGALSSFLTADINMSYSFIVRTGGFSRIWDFIQIISPDGNKYIRTDGNEGWGTPTEAYIYIGLLPWVIAVLGLVSGKHDLKRLWLLLFIGFGLLMLGPAGGLHRLLYYIYPPIHYARHMQNLVLFFVFTLLYFYILGFNRLFSTWGGQIFNLNYSQGILARFIFNKKMSVLKNNFIDTTKRRNEQCVSELKIKNNEKNIFKLQSRIEALESVINLLEPRVFMMSILIFSACIIISVYLMTKLTDPPTNYLFVLIIIIAAMGRLLRKELGAGGLYVSLIVSHILIVLIFTTNPMKFIIYIFLAFGFPIALFMLLKLYKSLSSSQFRYATPLLLTVFFVCLIGDLIYSLNKSSYLYKSMKHFGNALNVNTTAQKPFLPQKRAIFAPPLEKKAIYAPQLHDVYQGIRYDSLIYRHPFVFSSIKWHTDYTLNDLKNGSLEFVLKAKNEKWLTFSLPKKYFKLIYAYIPPLAIEEMFAVGKPMFQFKPNVVEIKESEIPAFLRQLGPAKSVELLQETVIIDEKVVPLRAKPEGYQKADQMISGLKEKEDFTYNIERYDYNSLDMNVYANKEGFLYWADGYDKNWHAFIDEKEIPIYRANMNFKAISIQKGANDIKFVYNPPFKKALYAFYGTFIVCIIAAGGSSIFLRRTL